MIPSLTTAADAWVRLGLIQKDSFDNNLRITQADGVRAPRAHEALCSERSSKMVDLHPFGLPKIPMHYL